MSAPHFDGTDYEPSRDWRRLDRQHDRVRDCAMLWPGGWFTWLELSAETGDPPGSVERQIRYLRAKRFGGFTVEKRVRGDRSGGLFEYRVVRPKPASPLQVEMFE